VSTFCRDDAGEVRSFGEMRVRVFVTSVEIESLCRLGRKCSTKSAHAV
jgi:hypothetical protein